MSLIATLLPILETLAKPAAEAIRDAVMASRNGDHALAQSIVARYMATTQAELDADVETAEEMIARRFPRPREEL
jgi:predicted exporter